MSRWSKVLPVLAAALAAFVAAPAVQAQPATPIVVDLFTSQGCNSCLPADAYLLDLAKRGDLIVMGYHVDYWDYIGWADTFATRVTTARQRGYMKSLRTTSVYTPQMVVGGKIEAVGADRGAVEAAIARARATLPGGGANMWFDYRDDGAYLVVEAPRGAALGAMMPATSMMPRIEGADVWLVLFTDTQDIAIARGENAGKTIAYTNVVRAMVHLAKWDGATTSFKIPSGQMAPDAMYCAAIVQMPNQGPILGAVKAIVTGGGW